MSGKNLGSQLGAAGNAVAGAARAAAILFLFCCVVVKFANATAQRNI